MKVFGDSSPEPFEACGKLLSLAENANHGLGKSLTAVTRPDANRVAFLQPSKSIRASGRVMSQTARMPWEPLRD